MSMFSCSRSVCIATLVLAVGCSDYDVSAIPSGPDLGPDDTDVVPTDPDDPPVIPVPGEVGSIHGRICAPDGTSWVSGATVSVATGSGVLQTLTDGDGWFTLDGIPVGTHDVTVTKGSFSTVLEATVVADQVTELPVEECLQQGTTRIAVITGNYDHIQTILGDLGLQYDTINGINATNSVAFLRDPAQLASYDVVFFNCGMNDAWMAHEGEITNNLRDFVTNGGSIYASDWAYYIVEASFRDQNTFHGDDWTPGSAKVGEAGFVSANVLSPSMQQLLGSNTADLNYDLSQWAAMVAAPLAEVLIEGTYEYSEDGWSFDTRFGPLATRFDYGNGTVIYTSFHNEQQTTVDMHLLLQDIVLSL